MNGMNLSITFFSFSIKIIKSFYNLHQMKFKKINIYNKHKCNKLQIFSHPKIWHWFSALKINSYAEKIGRKRGTTVKIG